MRQKTCETCGESFDLYTKRLRYCSNSCFSKTRIGPLNPNWRGEEHVEPRTGYVLRRVGTKPTGQPKYRQVHRLIAEKALGRLLRPHEVVHHINGDKADNRNANLLICDRPYHAGLHHKMSLLYAQEHFGGNT